MTVQLSEGSLAAIFAAGGDAKSAWKDPILQILLIKKLEAQDKTPERYRIVLSDGIHFTQGMIATQLNEQIANSTWDKGSIVKLTEFATGKVKEKTVLIVLGIEHLAEYQIVEKIGDPTQVTPDSAAQLANVRGNTATTPANFYGNNPGASRSTATNRSSNSRPVGGGSRNQSSAVSQIESLSPYQNRWTIKARCIQKSDVKTWHNQRSEGKLFSVTLMDQSGEIKATGFNDQCDTFYETFEEGGVYYISKCRVQMAKKQFSNVNNDYELTFERESEIERAEDGEDIPQQKYNFISLEDLQQTEKDAMVDVVAVIKEVGDKADITSSKTQKSFSKRELTLVDNTNYQVKLTVWGKTAENFEVNPESVVAFKAVKVSDFGGRSLSMVGNSMMVVDPDMEEAHKLRGWFDAAGRDSDFSTHQGLSATTGSGSGRIDPFKTIQQVSDEGIGLNETTADFYNLKATIVYIKSDNNISYPACRSEDCNKKVVDVGDGWRCEKCQKTFEKPEYRYILTISVNDHTGQSWLSVFDEVGKIIMGKTADELQEIRDEDSQAFEEIVKSAYFQTFNFRVKSKLESYEGQQRTRTQVMNAYKLDYAVEARKLMQTLKLYDNDGSMKREDDYM